MPIEKEKLDSGPLTLWGWPFIFLNLSFFMAFSNISFFYLYPLALDTMGAGHHEIGLVMGLFSVSAVISRPLFGKLVVLKGEFLVVSLGLCVSLIASMGYSLITTFGIPMLFIRIIHGIGFSAFISASFSLAAKSFSPEKRGEAFSIIGASLMGAVALAPPLGEFLIQQGGFFALYLAASGSLFLALLASFRVFHSISLSWYEREKSDARYLPLLKNRSYLFLLISTLIFAHCQASVLNFLAIMAIGKGASSGRFFFASYLAAILILLFSGKLIDRYGKVRFIIICYPLFSFGILLIPSMVDSNFFSVPAILFGAGMGLLFSTHNALAAGHGAENEKPVVMSLFTAVYDSGFITGAVLSGWFAHLTNLDTLFRMCGILGLGIFIVVIFSPIRDN